MKAMDRRRGDRRFLLVCVDYEGRWGMPFAAPYDLEAGTQAILDCLAGHGARAIFFTVGELAIEHPELVERIARDGHEIALHGWRHEHLEELDAAGLREFSAGLRASEDTVESITGTRPCGFRAPYLLGPLFFRSEIHHLLYRHGYQWTSNREIRHVVELLRPDRLGSDRAWRFVQSRPQLLEGPYAEAVLLMLNGARLVTDDLGGGLSPGAWLRAGYPPFFRGKLLEIPLYSPLDCDLVGFPEPTSRTPAELLEYATFALKHSVAQAGPLAMVTFHDWILSTGNRIGLLDEVLTSAHGGGRVTTSVDDCWQALVEMADSRPQTDTDHATARAISTGASARNGQRAGTPRISVVVCTHNGERVLPGVLAKLALQSLPASEFEVIVVDDGSTDRTAELADAAGARLVRLEENAGLAAARNAGVSAARAPLVAFTDDDCEPDEGWLSTLLDAFSDPEVDGIGGQVIPYSKNPRLRRYLELRNPLTPLSGNLLRSQSLAFRLAFYLRGTLLGDHGLAPGSRLYSVVGANMAFRKALLVELDGFDEAFRFGGEEEDLCRRAHRRAAGVEIRYEPKASVVHHFAPDFGDVFRRSRAYGRGNARASLKHPDVRSIVYPFPLLALGATALALARRRPWLGAAAAGAPLLLYPRWMAAARRTSPLELLTYPYIQAAQEINSMVGELEGFRAGYAPVPSRHLHHPARRETEAGAAT